jgi:hypothetical protein
MQTMAKPCKAKTKNGKRCGGYAVAGSDFCFTHDPARARERATARKRGGMAQAIPKVAGEWTKKIESIGDLIELLNLVILDTWQQENTAARSRALLAAIDTGARCLTAGEFEARLAALETILKNREVKP